MASPRRAPVRPDAIEAPALALVRPMQHAGRKARRHPPTAARKRDTRGRFVARPQWPAMLAALFVGIVCALPACFAVGAMAYDVATHGEAGPTLSGLHAIACIGASAALALVFALASLVAPD